MCMYTLCVGTYQIYYTNSIQIIIRAGCEISLHNNYYWEAWGDFHDGISRLLTECAYRQHIYPVMVYIADSVHCYTISTPLW